MPAVPPCLMQNAFSLQSAITLFARYAGIASQLLSALQYLQLRYKALFTLPSEAHLLKLHLPGSHRPGLSEKPFFSFTSSSSV